MSCNVVPAVRATPIVTPPETSVNVIVPKDAVGDAQAVPPTSGQLSADEKLAAWLTDASKPTKQKAAIFLSMGAVLSEM
jgi:hypothetical protein